ncbi:MAG TPA: hypothetical protein DD670_03970 [Planctomycetaceae bacterium]|nr:hypothetical protein [Planctomycetaceae bacterium]
MLGVRLRCDRCGVDRIAASRVGRIASTVDGDARLAFIESHSAREISREILGAFRFRTLDTRAEVSPSARARLGREQPMERQYLTIFSSVQTGCVL